MWVTVMELFQYGPHQCRLSVVAGVLKLQEKTAVIHRCDSMQSHQEALPALARALCVRRAKGSPASWYNYCAAVLQAHGCLHTPDFDVADLEKIDKIDYE